MEPGAGERGGRLERRIREVCLGEIGAAQRGAVEVGIREILAGEVPAGEIVGSQHDSGQIVSLVAGGGIELGGSEALGRGPAEACCRGRRHQ